MLDPKLIGLAAAAALVVKLLIDVLRLGVDLPRWAPPLLALVLGPLVVLGQMIADGAVLTPALVATALLSGALAAGAAVGVTELGQRAHMRQIGRSVAGEVTTFEAIEPVALTDAEVDRVAARLGSRLEAMRRGDAPGGGL
jgi:hypothetical protein